MKVVIEIEEAEVQGLLSRFHSKFHSGTVVLVGQAEDGRAIPLVSGELSRYDVTVDAPLRSNVEVVYRGEEPEAAALSPAGEKLLPAAEPAKAPHHVRNFAKPDMPNNERLWFTHIRDPRLEDFGPGERPGHPNFRGKGCLCPEEENGYGSLQYARYIVHLDCPHHNHLVLTDADGNEGPTVRSRYTDDVLPAAGTPRAEAAGCTCEVQRLPNGVASVHHRTHLSTCPLEAGAADELPHSVRREREREADRRKLLEMTGQDGSWGSPVSLDRLPEVKP